MKSKCRTLYLLSRSVCRVRGSEKFRSVGGGSTQGKQGWPLLTKKGHEDFR